MWLPGRSLLTYTLRDGILYLELPGEEAVQQRLTDALGVMSGPMDLRF